MSTSRDPSSRAWLLVAGGGTAGHVVPGLAVARELVQRGRPGEGIRFLGSSRGMEVSMVPEAGFELVALPGRGLNERRLNLENLRAALGLLRAALGGIREVRRADPAVLLSLGGYAAVAGVVGAVIWRVPIVVSEQNAKASLANRLAGRFARACAAPTQQTDLPRLVVTGNPVRQEVVAAARTARDPAARSMLRRRYGASEEQVLVAVMSGSLGARSVNLAVVEMVERLRERDDLVVHHVVGRRDWGTEHAPAPELGEAGQRISYRCVEYEERSDELLAAADLLIGRAGASTVAELAVIGVASILVPLPIAPRDVQRANAEMLAEVGSAVIVDDGSANGSTLAAVVDVLASDRERLRHMASRARLAGRPDAAERVADLCEEHARER